MGVKEDEQEMKRRRMNCIISFGVSMEKECVVFEEFEAHMEEAEAVKDWQ